MRHIENKVTEVPSDKGSLNYKDMIEYCLNMPVQGGYSMQQIQDRLRIKGVLDKSNGTVKLEDADYTNLLKMVDDSRWVIVHKDIAAFETAVKNAKEVKK